MHVVAFKTPIVKPGDDLFAVIAITLPSLEEKSIVVFASKIFATAENRFVPKVTGEKEEKQALARKEADLYLDPTSSKYNIMLTIKGNWMFANAGIDESNADGSYLLWPKDPQESANNTWAFLRKHYGVKEVGVTISDSSSLPLNWGVTGHAIAHCGFNPLRSYIGKLDLFGREMAMEQLNIAQSVTAAAVLEMGEGAEQTPFAVVSDLHNVEFHDHAPTSAELAALRIDIEDDVFAPLLTKAEWKKK
jgi:F420-0:gamma-glutamyl ligase